MLITSENEFAQGWDHRFFRWGETPNSRCSTTTTSTMTAPGRLGLSSTLSDLIILTKLGRAFGYMDAEIGLYPYTMDFESLQVEPFYHSFSNKQDSVHILWRVYCFKNQNVDSNNFSCLRIVRSHLVPPAAILDSGYSPCLIWKVSCILRHKTFSLRL